MTFYCQPCRMSVLDIRDHRRMQHPDGLAVTPDPLDLDAACAVMHDAYERAAVGAGWETQAASRKPWAEVPEANKATMRAAVGALIDHLEVRRLRAEVARLRAVGEDDIATWAEYVTGKKWAPVATEETRHA